MIDLRRIFGLVLLMAHLATEAAKSPGPRRSRLAQRLAAFPTAGLPLKANVTLHWDEHQVPFVDAGFDTDLATVLGLVHAHLRLGQMEMLRRLARGRLSEMIGPIGIDLDHLLRILDVGRAVPGILASLPQESRDWLEAFVSGVNHYIDHATELPQEFTVLALRPEPWTAADVLLIARLAAADANWLVWFQLLKLRQRKSWPLLWRRLSDAEHGSFEQPFPPTTGRLSSAGSELAWACRGSNSVAVSPARSTSGGALIASDPHLGIHLPNPWLIAGYRSPSHHAVGLMAPGLPFIAMGRNSWIAWGGTNLHAASSDFVDVTNLPRSAITERHDTINVRWWRERSITLRDTPFGPVISDWPPLGLDRDTPIALRWMGHRPSDEITAMLRVNQARNWDEFRAAIGGIAVPGQAMTYADAQGHIGKAVAVRLPARERKRLPDLVLAPETVARWQKLATGSDFPATVDPAEGFVVSANEPPGDSAVPIGFFFSPSDRAQRLRELVSSRRQIGVDELAGVLADDLMATSRDICGRFLDVLGPEPLKGRKGGARHLLTALVQWDGRYSPESRGALAFELVFHAFVRAYYDEDQLCAYWATWTPRNLVKEDLAHAEPAAIAPALNRAIGRSARAFRKWGTWGALHRLRLAHPFGLVPFSGHRYIWRETPAAGGIETILKSGHRFIKGRHAVLYGSSARHISDLSEPDGNYFVLAGGQDGWLGSSTYADQFDLWQRSGHVQVPFQLATVRTRFAYCMELTP